MLLRDLADSLEVAGLWEHDAEVHHGGFHDHAGRQATLFGEALNAALHRGRIVERDSDRHVRNGLRNAAAIGQGGVVLAVANRVVVNADRHHHVVVVAVVRAEDLDDRVATGRGAGNTNRIHRGLGARVRIAPLRQAPTALQFLGDDNCIFGRGCKVGALRHTLGDSLRNHGMSVTLDHRAEAVVKVDHLRAVDVPDLRANTALEIDRPRVAELVRRGDSAGQHVVGALVHLARGGGGAIKDFRFACCQLRDASAIQLDWCSYRHDVLLGAPDRAVNVRRIRPRRGRRQFATRRRTSFRRCPDARGSRHARLRCPRRAAFRSDLGRR